jgi:hypothetical protein
MNRILYPAPDTTPPAAPAAATASGIYPTSIMLDWSATPDNVGVAGYNIYTATASSITTSSLMTYFDQNLTPGETYSYSL